MHCFRVDKFSDRFNDSVTLSDFHGNMRGCLVVCARVPALVASSWYCFACLPRTSLVDEMRRNNDQTPDNNALQACNLINNLSDACCHDEIAFTNVCSAGGWTSNG
jgi:hypothetical protein